MKTTKCKLKNKDKNRNDNILPNTMFKSNVYYFYLKLSTDVRTNYIGLQTF